MGADHYLYDRFHYGEDGQNFKNELEKLKSGITFRWTSIEDGMPPVPESEAYINVFVVVKSEKDDRGFAERQGSYFLPNQHDGNFQLSNGAFYWEDDSDILAWSLIPEYEMG